MKTILRLLAVCALALSGCQSIEKKVRDIPPFEFKSWSHSDHYGVFTDVISMSGASWTLNQDGSATLKIDHYEGDAAYAGTVGPHDVVENLVINFPPETPQAQALSRVGKNPVMGLNTPASGTLPYVSPGTVTLTAPTMVTQPGTTTTTVTTAVK